MNSNNARANSNVNYGARPRSLSPFQGAAAQKSPQANTDREGRVPRGRKATNENPAAPERSAGIAAKPPEGGKHAKIREQKCHARQNTMKKLTNMKEHICSWENLIGAYKDAARCKRYRNDVLAFTQNLESNLLDIKSDLENRRYTVGAYREFYVSYPKRRLVMALGFRDRIVQWAIYRQINPFIDKRYIEHSFGCREGKGTLAAAQQLHEWMKAVSRKPNAGNWVILKCDVDKYFYRVDHQIALDIYAKYIDDEWLMWLLGEIINNRDVPFGLPEGMSISECPRSERLFDVGMPIGNLTSQETANLYLNEVDQYAKHVLKIKHYIRYMDDTIIIVDSRKKAEHIRTSIEAFMKERLKLSMNKKTVILPLSHGCEFVGYRVTIHGLRLRKKTTQHIKRALKRTQKLYSRGEIDQDKAFATIHSYLGMCKHINGYNVQRWIAENVVLRREAEVDG